MREPCQIPYYSITGDDYPEKVRQTCVREYRKYIEWLKKQWKNVQNVENIC